MKICGIICEYNPFHNGHIHHIQATKQITQCDLLVCVMSSSFVQRGEPAIIDKWQRTHTALSNGIDVLIELPFLYATQSASYFASAAIHLLKIANVDCICFGSESNDLAHLIKLSQIEESVHTKNISTSIAYEQVYGNLDSNDILGLNYLKAIQGTNIVPYTIQRTNQYLDDNLTGSISSATSIRLAAYRQQSIENTTPMKLDNPIYLEQFYPTIQFLLSTLDKNYLKTLFLMDEGIENLLIKHKDKTNLELFLKACTTKKYTRSRIQRTLVHLLNQTTKECANTFNQDYVRVLGFNQKAQSYLKNIPAIMRFSDLPEDYRAIEMKATRVIASLYPQAKKEALLKQELAAPLQWK